jgi:hypothetical protein
MKWNLIASAAIVLMLAYLIVVNHIDLYPWSNLLPLSFQARSRAPSPSASTPWHLPLGLNVGPIDWSNES